MKIITTRTYERAIRRLLSEHSRRDMEVAIAADPDGAPVVPGTGGIRKFRWTVPGRGKRGGVRTIYFYHTGKEVIYILTAYAKSAREDLTMADKKVLAKLVAEIKKIGSIN